MLAARMFGAKPFLEATGGTITYDGAYKIHTFTGNGVFNVTSLGVGHAESDVVQYLVVGGGGAGGYLCSNISTTGSGGGGGQVLSGSDFAVSKTAYTLTIGQGGTVNSSSPYQGYAGTNSTFSSITAVGGNGGADPGGTSGNGYAGGANFRAYLDTTHWGYCGGGGGGAAAIGTAAYLVNQNAAYGGTGGIGIASSISGTSQYYGGGGGGGANGFVSSVAGDGGLGGGGKGSYGGVSAVAGTANTGGGGGGSVSGITGVGGSGIVIIRYRYRF